MHPKLDGGDRVASVPINTFVNYTGPADLESAIAEAGGVPPRAAALRGSPPLASSPPNSSQEKVKQRGMFKVDPFEDMRGLRY